MTLTNRIQAPQLIIAVNMLKIMAHPIRLSIIDLLTEQKKMTVIAIQKALNLEQAIVSQHLTLLENKNILNSQKIGRNKYVWLKFPKMKKIITCIEKCCTEL